jgi:hypothetical protein
VDAALWLESPSQFPNELEGLKTAAFSNTLLTVLTPVQENLIIAEQ